MPGIIITFLYDYDAIAHVKFPIGHHSKESFPTQKF